MHKQVDTTICLCYTKRTTKVMEGNMPNWCYNNVTLRANNVGNRELLKEVATAANEGKEIFNLLRPMPDNIFRGDLGMEERKEHGENNWYDWSVAHWGTKWDTDAQNVFYDGETLTLSFDTAWSPPIELYEYLVEQGFSVLADYYEPGMKIGRASCRE